MKVILEIDHTVSKEEIINWIEEILMPSTSCVWGYSFEEHHCGSCHNSQLEKENAELKKQNSILKNDVRVAREDRERLQIKVGKGLKEFIHDCPYTALEHYASARLVKENAELKAQNKGLIHLLESIQSAISGIKKNKDKEIVLYWIKENAIRVFKEEKQKGFSFDWLK